VDCVAVTMGGRASATLYGMDASPYNALECRLAIDAARVGVQGSRLIWKRRFPFHRTKSCWVLISVLNFRKNSLIISQAFAIACVDLNQAEAAVSEYHWRCN
jgi:hypothetical protein